MTRAVRGHRETQDRMEALLRKAGIPAKRVHCYGHQVMITTYGRETANRWYSLLQKFCRTVRDPYEGIDYNKTNRNTVLLPTTHHVWRVWGTI